MARLTIQFPEKTSRTLTELSDRDKRPKTEILRRALALYKYLEDEVRKEDGRKVSITTKEDKIIKDLVITD